MTAQLTIAEGETGSDQVLAFTLPERDVRGRIVRFGPVLDTILGAHDYPAPIRHLLAEALVITALMGSLLRDDDSQLTLQAQSKDGVVDLLVCDYLKGAVRGYVRHDPEKLGRLGANPSLQALFGEGYMALTFDLATSGERYQGVVPLEGGTLAEVCEGYFVRSEQIPTKLHVAVRSQGGHCIAGGMLVQHLPDGEEGRERLHVQMDHPHWEHVSILVGTLRHDELVSEALSLEALVWRLFHEEAEVRVERLPNLSRGCRCTAEYYRSVLSRFPESELAEMRTGDGKIEVDCAFCSELFRIDL